MPLSINSYLEGPVTIRSLIISGILSFNPTYGFCVILWHQSGLLFLAFWSFPRFVPHILLTLSLTFTLMFPLWATTSYQVLSGGLPGLCLHSSLERLAILFYFWDIIGTKRQAFPLHLPLSPIISYFIDQDFKIMNPSGGLLLLKKLLKSEYLSIKVPNNARNPWKCLIKI